MRKSVHVQGPGEVSPVFVVGTPSTLHQLLGLSEQNREFQQRYNGACQWTRYWFSQPGFLRVYTPLLYCPLSSHKWTFPNTSYPQVIFGAWEWTKFKRSLEGAQVAKGVSQFSEPSVNITLDVQSCLLGYMEAVRTSETSVDNHFTRQYIPEDNSEHQTRRRENLKSNITLVIHLKAQW
jgi:hypothetical protein